jgi:hypothetical protein
MSASTSQALDYLEQLSGATHKKLYEQPSTALAVFRCMLPHLGEYPKHYLGFTADSYCSKDRSHGTAVYASSINGH